MKAATSRTFSEDVHLGDSVLPVVVELSAQSHLSSFQSSVTDKEELESILG